MGDPVQADALVDAGIKVTGSLDILVSNAGITRDALLVRMSDEKWEEVLHTNLTGAFNVTRAAGRQMMRQRSGRMVLISSVVALAGNVGQANYAASKAGTIALARTAAKELGPRGVTVNVIAPGFVETDMTMARRVTSYPRILPAFRCTAVERLRTLPGLSRFLSATKRRILQARFSQSAAACRAESPGTILLGGMT